MEQVLSDSAEGKGPCPPLALGFLSSGTKREWISLLSALQFAVLLLEEPQETNHLPSFSIPSPQLCFENWLDQTRT